MKYFILALSIMIIVFASCYFWYTWDVGKYKDELFTEYTLSQSKVTPNDTKADINRQLSSDNSAELKKEKPELYDNSNSNNNQTPDTDVQKTDEQSQNGNLITEHTHRENTERESPFGFGVYTEIPEGYPLSVSWDLPKDMLPAAIQRQGELVDRVLIKLYNEGDHDFIAGKWHNGKVYPLYPNLFYVKVVGDQIEINGRVLITRTIRILGPPGTKDIQKQLKHAITVGKSLPSITTLDMQTHGIDPYGYLFTNKGE